MTETTHITHNHFENANSNAIDPKLGAAAFAGAVVAMIAAYLAWGGIDVPPAVLATTIPVAGAFFGWLKRR